MDKKKVMIFAAIFILLAAAAAVVIIMAGKGISDISVIHGSELINGFTEKDEEQVLLVDYCKKTVATVGGDGYSETVLYQNRDGSCEVHYYSKYEYDKAEKHSGYSVDPAVIDAAYKIINDNRMVQWNHKYDSFGMEGAEYILKFRGSGGEYIRCSSEHMPDDGLSIMGSVNALLNDYVNETGVQLE